MVGERLHKVLGQTDFGTLDSRERLISFGLLVNYLDPFRFISVFELTAYLLFPKLQYVSSGFRCRVITGSMTMLYQPKLRSMTNLLSYECFHCSQRNSFFYFYSP